MFRKENAMECHPIVENGNEAICQEYVRSAIGLKPGCVLGPREQMNFATAFLDGSGIYGSTPKSSEDLRLLKGRLCKGSTKLLSFRFFVLIKSLAIIHQAQEIQSK